MSALTDLIHELTIATGQMKQAALTDDWIWSKEFKNAEDDYLIKSLAIQPY
ncbi:hypothetical protein [Chromatium okenii]|uniref:hypothetical protein n=1 Tax=Chromatium okenii TaxID=61644 RepID=UPI0015584662|nr:hypothetical protein [Chromatium okenii]